MAQIGDILAKLGRGELLTTLEQQAIRLWGNNTEYNANYIAGLQNGAGLIDVNSIRSNEITSEKRDLTGNTFYGWFRKSVPTGSGYTTMDLQIAHISKGFSTSGNIVTFLKDGFYKVHLLVATSTTTGFSEVYAQGLGLNAASSMTNSSLGYVLYEVTRYFVFRNGLEFYLNATHDEAGTIDCNAYIHIERMREYISSVAT